MTPKRYILLICLGLTLAVVIAFEPLRKNDFVEYDDDKYVTDNPIVKQGLTHDSVVWAFTNSHASNWHPVTWLSHMLDCQFFDLNPLAHHLTNLLFHLANTLLLFWILKKTTGRIWPGAFVAVAFALHPLHVESVAWVAERKDVLSAFFWMLTILAYISYTQHPSVGRYLWVLLAFVLGLMAKPMLVTLPFVLLLLDYWPLQRLNRQQRKTSLFIEKLPLFLLALISSIITYVVQQRAMNIEMGVDISLYARISNAIVSYLEYIIKIFYPQRLAVLYPHPGNTLPVWRLVLALLILTVISAGVFYHARRHRYLAVGWLWYLGTLVPVIGLVQVGVQAMADRYTYIPAVGIFIMFTWGISELLAKWRHRKVALEIAAFVVIIAMLISTRIQLQYWRNSSTLFERTLDVTENNFMMHYSYGYLLSNNNQNDDALMHFDKALQINPLCHFARNNKGVVLLAQQKFDEAIDCFERILQLEPNFPKARNNLGIVFYQLGKTEQAVTHWLKAEQQNPEDSILQFNLAKALFETGRTQFALNHFYKSIQLAPDMPVVLNDFAWILAVYDDDRVHNPLDAVRFAERACRITQHRFPEMLDTLSVAYAAAGNFAEAIKTAEMAVQLAEAGGKKELVQKIRQRIKLYNAGQPYREPLPDPYQSEPEP